MLTKYIATTFIEGRYDELAWECLKGEYVAHVHTGSLVHAFRIPKYIDKETFEELLPKVDLIEYIDEGRLRIAQNS